MNKTAMLDRTVLTAAFLIAVSCLQSYAQSTTMTGSNNSSVDANTVAVTTSDSVTLTTTSNCPCTINYDYTSSPGVNGPTVATAGPSSPAVSLFTLSSQASGNSNTINVSIVTSPPGSSQSPTPFTVVVPSVTIGNITNVPGFGSHQRVPIYGASGVPNRIEGTADVTITPNFLLPTGTKIQFKIKKDSGNNGAAQFDNGNASIDLTSNGVLNIQGTMNSDAMDNMEIDAYLDDNPSDQIINEGTLDNPTQSILLFTVSTWPTNVTCQQLLQYGGDGGIVGFIVSVISGSESGDTGDLTNCDFDEVINIQPWVNSTPPFIGNLVFNRTNNFAGFLIPNTGGSFEYPTPKIKCTVTGPNGGTIDYHTIPLHSVFGPGDGSITMNQQYEFEDNVMGTGMQPWLGTGQGQFTITATVKTNNTTNVRSLTMEKTGAGMTDGSAFDGVTLGN